MHLFVAKFRPYKGMKRWWYKMILAPDEIEAAKFLYKKWITSTGAIKYIRHFQKYHLLLLPQKAKIIDPAPEGTRANKSPGHYSQ